MNNIKIKVQNPKLVVSVQEAAKYKGEPGNGIESVTLLSTVGRVKTYRITFTDETTFDYTVTNGSNGSDGNGIISIARTSGTGAAGTTDTYTITFTDATTTTFNVVNGANAVIDYSFDIEADKLSTTKISAIKTFYDWAVGLFQPKLLAFTQTVQLTQAEYAALDPKVSTTLYIIIG